MNAVTDSLRGLVNSLSGLGSTRDKGARGTWYHSPVTTDQASAAYRSNWMVRKAIDIPVADMLREGWSWQAEEAEIEKIEAEEKRLDVAGKITRALKLSRLYGGSAIILGDGAVDPQKPLDVEKIGKSGLKYLAVATKQQIQPEGINEDIASAWFGLPLEWTVQASASRLHPSRVIVFPGAEILPLEPQATDVWGDSVLDAIEIAIRDATAGQQGIANLIQEASVDVVKVPGLTEKISTQEYKNRLVERFALAGQGKSLVNTLIVDAEEEWSQKTSQFTQLPDVLRLLVQIVSGAADIPATRFLGQSPAGMSATGESDLRNYYDRIRGDQEGWLRPRMDRIMRAVAQSATGSGEPWYEFDSLWTPTEKERAEIDKLGADTIDKIVASGTVPPQVLEVAVRNRLIESGRYPGIEQAYEEFEAASDDQAKIEAVDALPRPLYVSRKVVNAADILAWAKGQGVAGLEDVGDLHVTVAASRQPVDWIAMGQPWEKEIEVDPGGPRIVEPLGSKGAIVLHFAASSLSWRHEEMRRRGASWDFDQYQPHVTISYDPGDVDLRAIEPYRGKIVLGPEIFEEFSEDGRA